MQTEPIGITNLYEASGLDDCDDNEENSNDEDIKIFLKGLTIRYPHILFEFEISKHAKDFNSFK